MNTERQLVSEPITYSFRWDALVEEWRPINGWADYEVSNLGRVRSVRKSAKGAASSMLGMGISKKCLETRLGRALRPKDFARNHPAQHFAHRHRAVAGAAKEELKDA